MEPYLRRDSTVHDGKGLVDVVDPETFEHSLKEVQLRAAGPVKPFVFGTGEVKSLANHIRRELKL